MQEALDAGADALEKAVAAESAPGGKRCKRTAKTHEYDADVKTKIGQHTLTFGNKNAAEKFSRKLGHPVQEATVRNYMRTLQQQLKSGSNYGKLKIVPLCRGPPLLPGKDLDDLVIRLIQNFCSCGAPVSSAIILVATGSIQQKNPSSLKKHRGTIELKKSWAQSLLVHMGFVKRKGTRTARHLPNNFDEVKQSFLEKIEDAVVKNVHLPMVVNFDQAGTKMIPVNQWTIEKEGSKQVDIIGLDASCLSFWKCPCAASYLLWENSALSPICGCSTRVERYTCIL